VVAGRDLREGQSNMGNRSLRNTQGRGTREEKIQAQYLRLKKNAGLDGGGKKVNRKKEEKKGSRAVSGGDVGRSMLPGRLGKEGGREGPRGRGRWGERTGSRHCEGAVRRPAKGKKRSSRKWKRKKRK